MGAAFHEKVWLEPVSVLPFAGLTMRPGWVASAADRPVAVQSRKVAVATQPGVIVSCMGEPLPSVTGAIGVEPVYSGGRNDALVG